jgi:hypothetical protein
VSLSFADKTSLTPIFFVYQSAGTKQGKWAVMYTTYLCKGYRYWFASVSKIFLFDFGTYPTLWYFLRFLFYILCCHLMIVTCGNQHIVHGTFYASWISIFRRFYYFSDTMRYLKNRGTHVSVLLGSQIIIMFGQPSWESHKHDINTIAYEIYLPSQY